jgi:hypothetical protein
MKKTASVVVRWICGDDNSVRRFEGHRPLLELMIHSSLQSTLLHNNSTILDDANNSVCRFSHMGYFVDLCHRCTCWCSGSHAYDITGAKGDANDLILGDFWF